MIYRWPSFLAVVVWLPSPISRQQAVSSVELTDWWGGWSPGGWGSSQIIWRRESLVLYKSSKSLCLCTKVYWRFYKIQNYLLVLENLYSHISIRDHLSYEVLKQKYIYCTENVFFVTPYHTYSTGRFFLFFNVFYSTLLHLPPPQIPLCWRMPETNPRLLRLCLWQSDALTTLLDLIHWICLWHSVIFCNMIPVF